MTNLAVAIRPLTVEINGERVRIEAEELIPNFGDWPRSAREAVLDNEKAIELPDHDLVARVAADVPEFGAALFAALAARGYKVTKAAKA